MFVRVSRNGAGRLVRVRLAQIDHRYRLMVSRRLREQRWDTELRPDYGYSPTMAQRCNVLLEAVQLEAAANHPSNRRHYIPEEAAADVLRKHGA